MEAACCASRSGSNVAQQPFPAAFAQYSVMSAARISSAASVPRVARSITPMLADTDSSWPATVIGSSRAARIRSASATSSASPAESARSTMNSSPPSRATRLSDPAAAAIRSATWRSSSSPT